MQYRRHYRSLILLAVAGVLATLAIPGGRSGTETVNPSQVPFAALVADAERAAPLAPEERAAHLATLRARGPQALARFLDQAVGDEASEAERTVALESLEGCATGRELVTLVELALPRQGEPADAVLAGLRSAVARTLERDPRGYDALVPAWQRAGSDQKTLRKDLIAVVGERGDPAGLDFLAWVAAFETGAYDREVARACAPLAKRAWSAEQRAALERVAVLLDSADVACIQALAGALGDARLEPAIPALIELLESESRAVRQRVEGALRAISGLALGADVERWRAWYAGELAWTADEAPAVVAELAADDDTRVLAALRAIGARRTDRDALAAEVTVLLAHPTAAVRVAACTTLERLGSTLVLADLAGALEDEDDAVVRCAAAALRRLTGLDVEPDAEAWRSALARHGA